MMPILKKMADVESTRVLHAHSKILSLRNQFTVFPFTASFAWSLARQRPLPTWRREDMTLTSMMLVE